MIHDKPRGLRQRRREGNIEGFIDAALEVLLEEGYDALTVGKVAQRIGCAVGAMYRYFASKDELMVAVQRRVIDEINAQLSAALGRLDAHVGRARTLDKKQVALLRLMVVPLVHEWVAVERPAYFALLSLSISTPKVLVKTEQAAPSMMSLMSLNLTVARLFEEAAAAGALAAGDAIRRAVILWASHHGILQLRKLDRFGLPALAAANLSIETVQPLLTGWGASSDELASLYDRARKVLEQV
jgi:AcrR family transcriptional regulator